MFLLINSFLSAAGCFVLIILQQRAILQVKDSNVSSWLSVLPLARSQFDLSAQVFRDGLVLLYKRPLFSIPSACDGCGAPFVLSMPLIVVLGACHS